MNLIKQVLYMNREHILRTATNLFAHYGIKGVSMSQVAGALQISKRTLYEKFANKEELVSACIDFERNRMTKIIANSEKEAANLVEALLLSISDLTQYKSNFCPAFHRDITRYPELCRKLSANREGVYGHFLGYFRRGIAKGYFKEEFEYETITDLILEQTGHWSITTQQPYFMFTFLKGVCTEKGLEALDSFIPTNIRKYS